MIPVPRERQDAVSIFLHEIARGLGINGFLDPETGTPREADPRTKERYEPIVSTYDQHVEFDGRYFFFHGPAAMREYGNKPVPLTCPSILRPRGGQANNYHDLGDVEARDHHLYCDLMNGFEIRPGWRYHVSRLDLAILSDVGVPVLGL